uniref:GNAT family N-acetyltransferase n=1 Tax=Candidatus Fimivicinus sp. TaxID=3056640 RepID=UPI003FF0CF45
MIRRARREDIPLLMELWETSFGDSRAYISFFFKRRFSPQETFLFEWEGRPVSMLFLLDAQLQHAGKRYAVRYLYAACTAPSFRGQGVMHRLIDFAARSAAEEGADGIALVPASQGLFRYYAGCGFQNAFFCETLQLSRQEMGQLAAGSAASGSPLAVPEMTEIRRTVLQTRDHLAWDAAALEYALEEHEFSGGSAIGVRSGEQQGYCLFDQQDDVCCVQELLISRGAVDSIFSALMKESDAHIFSLRCPVGLLPFPNRAEKRAYGMLRPVSPRAARLPQTLQNAYLGLSLG